MKKNIFLPLLMITALAGCNGNEPQVPTNWSVEIKGEMNTHIGEVLPYVAFGEGFYHTWENNIYSIGDRGTTSVLKGYGALLTANGWTEYNIKEDDITYKKQNDAGYLTLKADFSSVGNNISVTVRDSEGGDPVGGEWSEEIKSEMMQYLGEVLPYAPLDEKTLGYELYYEYTIEDDGVEGYNWWIWDDSVTNVLEDYGKKLIEAGFVEGEDELEYIVYSKVTAKGQLDIYCDWYDESTDPDTGETVPAGNQIDCYFYKDEGGGVDPTPTSGSVEIVIGNISGYATDTEFGTRTINPGVTISAAKESGSNDPRFWTTTGGDKELRLYAKNSISFSADKITKIEFTYSKKDNQQFTPSVGNISNNLETWTGSASSVKFTLGNSGQLRITKIVVYGEFSGGGVDPVVPGDARTTKTVAEEIASNLDFSSSAIYWDGEDAYIECVFEGVTTLKDACEAAIPFLPDYLEEDEAPYADTWKEGDDGYFASYVDFENFIYVEIGSYYDSGECVTQFCVFYGY